MADMTDDDFYVNDETPEEFEAAWRQGERGVTAGPRDLNERAKSIVDRAVGRLDQPREAVRLVVVSSKTLVHTTFHTEPGGRATEDTSVTQSVAYPVAVSGT